MVVLSGRKLKPVGEDYYDQLDSLLRQAQELPDGLARTELIRQAVKIADLTGDEVTQFHVRTMFVQSAFDSGEADEMLVALGWCVGVYDKDPETFDSAFGHPDVIIDVMSSAFAYLTTFPTISRKKIETMLDDYEQRYRRAGLGLRTLYLERTRNSFWLGDLEKAKVNFEKVRQSPSKDGWGEEHERIFTTDYYIHMYDDEAAVAEAEPVIQSSGPIVESAMWILSFVLAPLVRLNRLDDARACQQHSYRMVRQNPKYLGLAAKHLIYLTAIGDHTQAVTMLETHAPWLNDVCCETKKMTFFVAGWKLFRDLAANGTSHVRINLPESVGPAVENNNYACQELADWFQTEAEKIRDLFNKRNGNEAVSREIQSQLDLQP